MLTILVAIDDALSQQELVEMLRDAYQQKVSILKPTDHQHLMELLVDHYIDLIFIDMDQSLLRKIRSESDEPAIIGIGVSGNQEYELELVSEGMQDVLLTADLNPRRLLRTIEYALRRHRNLMEATSFMRLERDIGQRTTMQSLVELVTDIILRRTGAKGCVIGWIGIDGTTMTVLKKTGSVTFVPDDMPMSVLKADDSFLGELFRTEPGQRNVSIRFDIHTNHLILALEHHQEPKGFVSLEGMPYLPPTADLLRFLRYLSKRLVVALEKVLGHERTQYHVRQMTNLYKITVSITSTMDAEDVLELGAWGLGNLLEVGGAFACTYDAERNQLIVKGRHATFELDPYVPMHGTIIDLTNMQALNNALHTGVLQRADIPEDTELLYEFNSLSTNAILVLPLLQDDSLVGAIIGCHSDLSHRFMPDDVAVAQSFAIYLISVLTQAHLYDRVKELQDTKSEMIQRVSHDLKNPINLMVGYLALLIDSVPFPTDEQLEYFNAIERSIGVMTTLVQDILVLERVEAMLEAAMHPVDVIPIINQIVELGHQEAQLKAQTIDLRIGVDTVWVLGDGTQLYQAYQNLIGNALKYTPDGGTVTIRANVIDNEFWFEVEDTGYGIPPEKQARLFERFYRAHTPGTEHIKGTGLGLYLVKAVAERHNGRVWYEPAPERGSIFGLRIPLAPTSS